MRSRFTLTHSLRIILALGWADFVLKYRGSVLGYLWSFVGPLVYFVVLYHVLRPFVSAAIPHYPLYLFLGIILFEHFSLTTAGCIGMLYEKGDMIQKVRIPRILLVFSVGWMHLLIFMTRFVIFLLFALFLGVRPGLTLLALPLVLLHMTLLGLGIGMLLCSYALRYRDIGHLWGVVLQVLFWATPVAYPSLVQAPVLGELVAFLHQLRAHPSPGALLNLFIHFQPLSLLLAEARRFLLISPLAPPSLLHVSVLTLLYGAMFWIGAVTFRARSRYFIQEY